MALSVLFFVQTMYLQLKRQPMRLMQAKKTKRRQGLPPSRCSVMIGKKETTNPQEIQLQAAMKGMAEGGTTSGRQAHPIGPKDAPQTIIYTAIPIRITKERELSCDEKPTAIIELAIPARANPATIRFFLPWSCRKKIETTVKMKMMEFVSVGISRTIYPVNCFWAITPAQRTMALTPDSCCREVSITLTSAASGITSWGFDELWPISAGVMPLSLMSSIFCWYICSKYSSLQIDRMRSSQAFFSLFKRRYLGVSQGKTKTNTTI